jgi:decaprenylphospho-beta-D-ribofuranose 2-oxidase
MDLVLADGSVRTVTPERDPDVFWATAGGMGLTGVVVACTFAVQPVETSRMTVDTTRAGDLDECIALMTDADTRYRYSVAWVDMLASGRSLGRSVLTCGDHAPLAALSGRAASAPRAFDATTRLAAPPLVPGGLLNMATVRAFNEAWFRRAPRHRTDEIQPISTFFHPLDGVHAWNRMYGPRGFLQYQFVVPFGEEDALRRIVKRLSSARVPSFLAVLKRFGPANPGLLSFPQPGWTLALDIPAAVGGLAELLDALDVEVVDHGGRLYLAKDSRMPAHLLPTMYPELDRFLEIRHQLDPQGVLQSDLGRRLGLCGPAPARSAP